eukprot:1177671-Rhodomonas_salina.1
MPPLLPTPSPGLATCTSSAISGTDCAYAPRQGIDALRLARTRFSCSVAAEVSFPYATSGTAIAYDPSQAYAMSGTAIVYARRPYATSSTVRLVQWYLRLVWHRRVKGGNGAGCFVLRPTGCFVLRFVWWYGSATASFVLRLVSWYRSATGCFVLSAGMALGESGGPMALRGVLY